MSRFTPHGKSYAYFTSHIVSLWTIFQIVLMFLTQRAGLHPGARRNLPTSRSQRREYGMDVGVLRDRFWVVEGVVMWVMRGWLLGRALAGALGCKFTGLVGWFFFMC